MYRLPFPSGGSAENGFGLLNKRSRCLNQHRPTAIVRQWRTSSTSRNTRKILDSYTRPFQYRATQKMALVIFKNRLISMIKQSPLSQWMSISKTSKKLINTMTLKQGSIPIPSYRQSRRKHSMPQTSLLNLRRPSSTTLTKTSPRSRFLTGDLPTQIRRVLL